ncbi:MAG: hypothetical protein IPJ50_13635 [Betaproteobacteria bacterium]|nr:hypothetical protein [Betaproteobacteria bacterium]
MIIVGAHFLGRSTSRSRGDIAHESGAYLHADVSHTATFVRLEFIRSRLSHSDFVSFNTVRTSEAPMAASRCIEQLQRRYTRPVFPTSQGGANENGMLGKFAALLGMESARHRCTLRASWTKHAWRQSFAGRGSG